MTRLLRLLARRRPPAPVVPPPRGLLTAQWHLRKP